MKTHKKLNIVVITMLLVLVVLILLILNDSPISWKIPETFILGFPIFFLITLVLSIISFRINKNKTAIITSVISSIFFALTFLVTMYLMSYTYSH
ncbi:hypothetical protein SAMN04488096_10121 [Mesonia phycicola]|uniref:Uncharacterized protein n=1 Tax=Mesonia phycicola TaxID=579105 RepID=A0A1M6A203_9FLAO|nr:hypothetical protein SAMN04488096_10121 [Mesonia phycicola]